MGKIIKYKKIIFLLILLGIFTLASSALALELVWPPPPGGTALSDATTLPEMVEYFYRWGIALGGLAAFIALIWAGFQYLTSAGDPAKIKDAKDRITAAISGLVLLLASFLILNTINPELTTLEAPVIKPPSDTLEPIPPETPLLERECKKVIVYGSINCQGASVEVPIGKTPLGGVKPYSVEAEGYCNLYLYSSGNCSGEAEFLTTVFQADDLGAPKNCRNYDLLGAEEEDIKKIQCAEVKKL